MKNNQSMMGLDTWRQAIQLFAPLHAGENWVQFWRNQDKVLDSMQEFANGWFERRHVAANTALYAAQRASAAESPVDVIQELQAWSAGSIQRIAEDGLACRKYLMTVAGLPAWIAAQDTQPQTDAPAEGRADVPPPAKAA